MSVLTVGQDSPPIEIDVGGKTYVATFSPNGEYLMTGDQEGVQVRRLQDGKHIKTLATSTRVESLMVSHDSKWIAGGTDEGKVLVWNAETYRQRFALAHDGAVTGLDFSPSDSSRLISASRNGTATVWDVLRGTPIQTLDHDSAPVVAAKYSPRNFDRIATATPDAVRIWDGDGDLLVNVCVTVVPEYNSGLVWFNDHLFVLSSNTIKEFETRFGLLVSEWPVSDCNYSSCLVVPRHGEFIACSTNGAITFWDIETHNQLSRFSHSGEIYSIAPSPDDRFLVVGGECGTVSIKSLSRVGGNCSAIPEAIQDDRPPTVYATPTPRLMEWTNARLENRSWKDILTDTAEYGLPKITIYQVICECLEAVNRLTDAIECFHQMTMEFGGHTDMDTERFEWTHDLRQRLSRGLEHLGDTAVDVQQYDDAISNYTKVLALNPPFLQDILIKRARACVATGSWQRALDDVNQVTTRVTIYMAVCECLENMDRLMDTVDCLFEVTKELRGGTNLHAEHLNWVFDSRWRYSQKLEHLGDTAADTQRYDAAIFDYSTALSLNPPYPQGILIKRAKACAASGSWKQALGDVDQTNRVSIYLVLCECLEQMDRVMDAVECFHQMSSELGGEMSLDDEQLQWALGFRQRSSAKLEHLGDIAVDAQQYDQAISDYSTALSLCPPSTRGILIKRYNAYVATGSWKQAVDDANQVITLDPSSPRGYEIKHIALRGAGDYESATVAFEEMISKMEKSPDLSIQLEVDQYVRPSSTRATIRKIVQKTIRHLPRELINTATGRLHGRIEQASAFEASPTFHELVSSMTRRIDYGRIKHEVRQFFRYVMLSHKWDDDEPPYQLVMQTTVYDLGQSQTHEKLQMFCKVVQDGGFKWAWSDTCCINKSDHFVLQEALVAMFKWYRGSAMVIVYLRGVHSSSLRGALTKSVWNTRAWTLQEYIAGRVIHFYTEGWTPYLDLELLNHKESPEIIAEMEQATGISAQRLMALRPGLTSVREKLRLASTRQTTRAEDTAYSLLGIFSAVGIQAIYGEGEEASLGRLLANVLTRSGDVSILAWTGKSGHFNSCLPARIGVFNRSAASHLPPPIQDHEAVFTDSDTSSFDLDMALRLYDRLNGLPTARFAESRMTLPCIAFPLPSLLPLQRRVFLADSPAFGKVEIKTRQDLSWAHSLYLIYPWLDALLEREETNSGVVSEDNGIAPISPIVDDEDEEIDDDPLSFLEPLPIPPYSPPVGTVPLDRETRARRLVARLRRPFGALLVAPAGMGRSTDYRRVAADSVIRVRLQEEVSLQDVLDNVRTLDIL